MEDRVRRCNERQVRGSASYVLYWMQMNRRTETNHALEFAAGEANRLRLPLLVYEAVTCTYPYASDRFHAFLLEGVPGIEQALAKRGIGYAFYLRRRKSDANDVLYHLAARAAILVSDDYPAFIAAKHNASVPPKVDIPYFAVDSSCIVPMRLHQKREYGAYTIRPKIHRLLPQYLRPVERQAVQVPFRGQIPPWHVNVTPASVAELAASCEIDHSVPPSLSYRGGAAEARRHLRHFLDHNLRRYAAERNEPSSHATSNLSPWLHFGHISAMDIALEARLFAGENDVDASSFLEELIVRRELAFNHACFSEKPASLDSIPAWARATIEKHRSERRSHLYSREEFEGAGTHDQLWNATQKELLLRGKIHGYYRMYWGKKIIEWSPSPEAALDTMVYLHDRYALDGRDPNTYANILWCFGLHDRPWQERPVFGMVRYMSLEGMKRKTNVDAYIREIEHLELAGVDPFRLK